MDIKLSIQKIPPGGAHIFVSGRICGKRITYLIDTGASKSVMDKKYLTETFPDIPITEVTQSTAGLGAMYEKSEYAELQKIEIGGFKIAKKAFAVLDFTVINTAYTQSGFKPIQAIIGGDILVKYKGIVDYKKKALRLFKK